MLAAAFFCLCVGVAGRTFLPAPSLRKETVSFSDPEGRRIAATAYRAESAPGDPRGEGPMPAAVLCHGISCSKELMNTIGRDLARHGFSVLAFDYGGHGESDKHPQTEEMNLEDVRGAIAMARRRPEVDPKKVVLVGHSMGSTTAAMAGMMDPDVCGVVCLGKKGPGGKSRPRNLLHAFGLYDQYHTVRSMVRAIADWAGEAKVTPVASIADVSSEQFSKPGNRALLVSPDGDHASEVYSVRMIPRIRNWLRQSVSLGPVRAAATDAYRVYFDFLMGFGAYASGLLVLGRIRSPRAMRCWASVPACLTFAAWAWIRESDVAEPLSLALTMTYLVFSTGLYCSWKEQKGATDWAMKWLQGLLLLWASFALGSVAGSLDQWMTHWEDVLWAPVALLNIVVHRCHFVCNILRADLFSAYSRGIIPTAAFAFLLLAEIVLPGFVWRGVGWLASMIHDRIANFRLTLRLGVRDKRAVLVLIVLVAALAAVVWARYREGLLGASAIAPAAPVLVRMYLLPLAVLVCLIRVRRRLL